VAAQAIHRNFADGLILASIGPLGHKWDHVVWPWNIAMMWFVAALFWRDGNQKRRHRFWSGEPVSTKVIVCIFWVLPALSLVDLMDSYPAFSLYSGNNNQAAIYMADSVAGGLPDRTQESIDVNESEVDELDFQEWTLSELNVTPYPEVRVFQNIASQVCASAGNPVEMALVVWRKSSLLHRRRLSAYDCRSLNGGGL
jgi:hypothetical protein